MFSNGFVLFNNAYIKYACLLRALFKQCLETSADIYHCILTRQTIDCIISFMNKISVVNSVEPFPTIIYIKNHSISDKLQKLPEAKINPLLNLISQLFGTKNKENSFL